LKRPQGNKERFQNPFVRHRGKRNAWWIVPPHDTRYFDIEVQFYRLIERERLSRRTRKNSTTTVNRFCDQISNYLVEVLGIRNMVEERKKMELSTEGVEWSWKTFGVFASQPINVHETGIFDTVENPTFARGIEVCAD
jgi:hypothetical protein